MSSVIDDIERGQLRKGLPGFDPGDRVRVHFQVVEGSRRRTQVFEGIVLRRQGSGARETFTVRKQSFGVGVERTFPLHSPKIEKLEIAARGDVRRAKLYYLRGRVGKAARVAERRWGIDEEMVSAPPAEAVATDAEGVSQEEAEAVAAPLEAETEDGGAEGESDEPTAAATEAPAEAEQAEATEPEASPEAESAAGPDAEAPAAGETEESTEAPEDAEDEEPENSGDSDEDSK